MPQANFSQSVTVFDDVDNASNPLRRHVDWRRVLSGVALGEVYSDRFVLQPNGAKSVFASTSIDAHLDTFNTVFVTSQPGWLVFQDQGTALAAIATGMGSTTFTVTLNADSTINVSRSTGTFTGILAGDTVFLSGVGYGQAAAFGTNNQGFWLVQRVVSTTALILARATGSADPTGVAETVVSAAANDFQRILAPTYDHVLIRGGVLSLVGVHSVVAAANGWFAIASNPSLPALTGLTFTQLLLASNYVVYARVESSQRVSLTVNGGALVVTPPADGQVGWFETYGWVTSLTVTADMSDQPATVNVIFANQD